MNLDAGPRNPSLELELEKVERLWQWKKIARGRGEEVGESEPKPLLKFIVGVVVVHVPAIDDQSRFLVGYGVLLRFLELFG